MNSVCNLPLNYPDLTTRVACMSTFRSRLRLVAQFCVVVALTYLSAAREPCPDTAYVGALLKTRRGAPRPLACGFYAKPIGETASKRGAQQWCIAQVSVFGSRLPFGSVASEPSRTPRCPTVKAWSWNRTRFTHLDSERISRQCFHAKVHGNPSSKIAAAGHICVKFADHSGFIVRKRSTGPMLLTRSPAHGPTNAQGACCWQPASSAQRCA